MKIWLIRVLRVLLGAVFVFSGFVKAIDPWGTALKVSEYLGTYGLSWLDGMRIPFAVSLSGLELALGLMLVAGICRRFTAVVSLVFMVGFTAVTLVSATVLPVGDCGCFGDAVHLSPWASLGKNVVLLVLATVVWWFGRGEKKTRRDGWLGAIFSLIFVCIGVCLGIGSYRHLPMIDFLPFKKGTDLREALYGDKAWESDIALREFVLFNSLGDATQEVLDFSGKVYILVAADLEKIHPKCTARFEKIIALAGDEPNSKVIVVTSSELPAENIWRGVSVYNMGSGTMLSMLRARTGMVVLEDGVIVGKKNCREIK